MIVSLTETDLTKWVSYGPCRVTLVKGFNNNGTDRYLQLHQRSSAASDPLTNGTVPAVKSLHFPASTSATYGSNILGDLPLNELTIAISTTEESYTAPSAGEGLDLTINVEGVSLVRDGITTMVGDLATGVSYREIWPDSSGYKRLVRLDIINGSGAPIIPIIQAVINAPEARLSKQASRILSAIAIGASRQYFFGPEGGQVLQRQGVSDVVVRATTVNYAGPGYSYDLEPGILYHWTKAGSATQIAANDVYSGIITITDTGAFIAGQTQNLETATPGTAILSTITKKALYRSCFVGLASAITLNDGATYEASRGQLATFISSNDCAIRAIYE